MTNLQCWWVWHTHRVAHPAAVVASSPRSQDTAYEIDVLGGFSSSVGSMGNTSSAPGRRSNAELTLRVALGVANVALVVWFGRYLVDKVMNVHTEDHEAADRVRQRMQSRLRASGASKLKFNSYEKLAMGVRLL